MIIKKHIPNSLTAGNFLCGCISISLAFGSNLNTAAWFIIIGTIFDFFDGMTARLLHVKSDIGKQLDSLADVVTFGVAPSVIAYILLKNSVLTPSITIGTINIVPFFAYLIAIFSAIRLAKFNIDERQTDSFIGVPTPANALLFAAFPIINWNSHFNPSGFNIMLSDFFSNSYVLLCIIFFMSFMLVSELPLFSLKFKTLKWSDNKIKFTFIGLAGLYAIIFRLSAIPFIVFTYIILSAFIFVYSKNNNNQ